MSLDDQIIHPGGEKERPQNDLDLRQPSFISASGGGGHHTRPRSPPAYLSPPQSPLGNVSLNTPMTSTPLNTCSSLSTPPLSQPSSKLSPNSISIVPVSSDSASSNGTSESPQLISSLANTNNSSLTENAITIIQVESKSTSSSHLPESSPKPPPILQETDLDDSDKRISAGNNGSAELDINLEDDVDGLAITRIRISGGAETSRNSGAEETTQVVKVSVLSSSLRGLNDGQDGEERLRLEEGMGPMGSQPSDLNDTVSEMSSVINNPSVISQIPDRYGFMGGEQYTHERYVSKDLLHLDSSNIFEIH
jgi:hypothetical protein